MSGELCKVHLKECCDVRVVTVLHVGLWRKNYLFLQSDCSIGFQMKIHIAHFFPEMTCSSRCSETINALNVSFFPMTISNLGTWWSRGCIWTVLHSNLCTKFLKALICFLNAAILLALKVFCGKRILQFKSLAERKQPFLFLKTLFLISWWLLLQAVQDFSEN